MHANAAGNVPSGFQNSATGPELAFYAARSYSLMTKTPVPMSSLTTTVFSQRSMRRFEASLRKAAPKGHETFISRTAPHQGLAPTSSPPRVQDTPRHPQVWLGRVLPSTKSFPGGRGFKAQSDALVRPQQPTFILACS